MLHHEFAAAVAVLAQTSITHPRLGTVGRLGWAVEEELHRGTDGREYLVPTSCDDEWTITLGWGQVIAELPYSIDPSTADGFAILNGEDGDHAIEWHLRVHRVDPSPITASETQTATDDQAVAAVSIERLGALLASAFASARPGIDLVHDPSWQIHRHPLVHLMPPSDRRHARPH